MSHRISWLVLIVGGAVLILSGSGCGPGAASVSGNVTYEGKPLERGEIALVPKNGAGPTIGSPITSGQYKIAKLNPGTYLVTIAAAIPPPPESTPRTREAYQAYYATLTSKDMMPAEAGHNLTLTAHPGENTRDFSLKRPKNMIERRIAVPGSGRGDQPGAK